MGLRAPPLARGWTLRAQSAGIARRAPPLARGWTRDIRVRARVAWLPRSRGDGPVRAGVTGASRLPRSRGDGPWRQYSGAHGLPRSRGDGPVANAVDPDNARKAPPPARGWTRGLAHLAQERGSPARAGMDPTGRRRRTLTRGLPRSRGDGPSRRAALLGRPRAPPLARGWTRRRPRHGRAYRLPRSRGDGPPAEPSWRLCRWLPRSRGDGPLTRAGATADAAPPLTRGWTRPGTSIDRAAGLPRSRGDGPARPSRPAVSAPPLTRGWTPDAIRRTAGRTAPPLTRGWTPPGQESCDIAEGSPAHAGMDPRCSRSDPCA